MNYVLKAARQGRQGRRARFELRIWRIMNFVMGTLLGLCLAGMQGALLAGVISAFAFLGPEILREIQAFRKGAAA